MSESYLLELPEEAKLEDPTPGRLATWDAITKFFWGGNATFTLVSNKTGMRYTYRLRVKKQDVEEGRPDPVHFLSLLRGPDNERDYAYVGVVRKAECALRLTPNSRMKSSAPAVQAMSWFTRQLARRDDKALDLLQFWHIGRCGRCGRLLTVPSSVASGIGPVCDGRGGAE